MSNNNSHFNNQNLDLRYNLGVEYKISENSVLYFQLSNLESIKIIFQIIY